MLVYIREAHPDSVLPVSREGEESFKKIAQTSTVESRTANAQICVHALKLSVPTVVDREDNRVNRAYAGWPDRLYVVGSDGRIAYRGGPGPAGFRVSDIEDWLRRNTK